MPEIALAVVFFGLAGAAVVGLPIAHAILDARRRKALLRCFLFAVDDGQARFSHSRSKMAFVAGFVDTYEGRAGLLVFSLSTRFMPFHDCRRYVLQIGQGGGRPVYERWSIEIAPEDGHPIVRACEVLRSAHARKEGYLEAS